MSAQSQGGLLAVCVSFTVLSTVGVGLRLYGRRRQRMTLQLDDWIALFGVITYIASSALCFELVARKALWEASALTNKANGQMQLAYDFVLMNTIACAKLSALFWYLRIFNVAGCELFNKVVVVTLVIVAAWYIAFDVLSLCQCPSRFSALWGTFEAHKRYCPLNPVWARGLAISDFILDLWVVVLPVPMIWRRRLNKARKLSITAGFFLAYIGVGASIARIIVFYTVAGPGAETLYIGMLEAGMTITVVNLPVIWFAFTSETPSRNSSGTSSSRRRSSVASIKDTFKETV